MVINLLQPKLSPEDERFVLECIEDDDLVLTIRRMITKNPLVIAQYVSGAVGCEMLLAHIITREILKT